MTESRRLGIALAVVAWFVMLYITETSALIPWFLSLLGLYGDQGTATLSDLGFLWRLVPGSITAIAAVVVAHRSMWVGSPSPRLVALVIVAAVAVHFGTLFVLRYT